MLRAIWASMTFRFWRSRAREGKGGRTTRRGQRAPLRRATSPWESRDVVALLPVVWVVTAPFALAAVISGSPAVNRHVARHLPLLLALGWLGVAMVLAGAFLAQGTT